MSCSVTCLLNFVANYMYHHIIHIFSDAFLTAPCATPSPPFPLPTSALCPTLGRSSSRLPEFCWPVLFPHSQSETVSAYTSYGRESSLIILEPTLHTYSISFNYWFAPQFAVPKIARSWLSYLEVHVVPFCGPLTAPASFALPQHTPLLTHRISTK